MKLLLIIIFPAIALGAPGWKSVGTNSKNTYMRKGDCEKRDKNLAGFVGCFDVEKTDPAVAQVVDVDDESKPIYRTPNDSPVKIDCDDPDDCAQKMVQGDGTVCDADESVPKYAESDSWGSIIGLSSDYFIWCEKIISYQKKKDLIEDPVKKSQFEADQLAKAQEEQKKALALRDIRFGEGILLEIVANIKSKSVSKAKRKKAVDDWSSIVSLLKIGSIDVAKNEIQTIVPDGEVITTQERDAIVQKITDAGY